MRSTVRVNLKDLPTKTYYKYQQPLILPASFKPSNPNPQQKLQATPKPLYPAIELKQGTGLGLKGWLFVGLAGFITYKILDWKFSKGK